MLVRGQIPRSSSSHRQPWPVYMTFYPQLFNLQLQRTESKGKRQAPPKLPAKPLSGRSYSQLNGPLTPLYQPLEKSDSVRLLVLEPGSGTDPIHCRLKQCELSNIANHYEALSYTWGDERITKPITCSERAIDVSANLYVALRDLRHPDEPRVLWVDALCINQQDFAEKSIQVPLMSAIYSKAKKVLIYLGEETSDVGGAIELIPRLQRYYNRLMRFRKWLLKPLSSVLGPLAGGLMDLLSPARRHAPMDMKPVISLFQRPWFYRTWTIQEAVLAQRVTVCCGRKGVPWEALADVSWGMYNVGGLARLGGAEFARAMEAVDVAIQERHNRHRYFGLIHTVRPPTMVDLLIRTRLHDCTNKRDKIYGLLGIAADAAQKGKELKPDYSFSVEQVYRDFVIWNVLKNGSLASFSCASKSPVETIPSGPPEPKLLRPSWVPDFANLQDSLTLLPLAQRGNFDATRGAQVMARILDRKSTLSISGVTVDKLHIVGKTLWPTRTTPPNKVLVIMPILFLECLSLARKDDSSGRVHTTDPKQTTQQYLGLSPARYEEFWRAMMFGHDHNAEPVSPMYGPLVGSLVRKVLRRAGFTETGKAVPRQAVPFWTMEVRTLNTMVAVAQHRRFVVTSQGRLGWVPEAAVPGDLVCALYGGPVLYVLRERGDGRYRLVGDCYVHGLMEGEVMGNVPRLVRESREFDLM